MKDKNIHIPMLGNGLDFIVKSLETINKKDEKLKYSVINLHAGIQLLLKELLYQEHWSLIFNDIKKVDKKKLKSGDFASVGHEELVSRLEKIVGIEFNKELAEKLDWLRKERNKVEHYQFVVTVGFLKSNIAILLMHLIPFIREHLVETGLLDSDDNRLTEIKDYLREFDDYVKEKMEQIEPILETIDRVFKCPECLQRSVEFEDSIAHCYFCDENIEDFGEKYIDTVINRAWEMHDGGSDPVFECTECEMEKMIYLDKESLYLCLECGAEIQEHEVTTCTGPACTGSALVYQRYGDELEFCHHCIDYFRNAD